MKNNEKQNNVYCLYPALVCSKELAINQNLFTAITTNTSILAECIPKKDGTHYLTYKIIPYNI